MKNNRMGTSNKLLIAIVALKEITKKKGRFSNDRLTHASNCVEDMAKIAENALEEIE